MERGRQIGLKPRNIIKKSGKLEGQKVISNNQQVIRAFLTSDGHSTELKPAIQSHRKDGRDEGGDNGSQQLKCLKGGQ